MGDTFITDMTHFEGISSAPSHEPARRMAQFFGAIVSAASVSPADELIEAALFCQRRPGRIRCPGHLQIRRNRVTNVISWHCSRCDDQGEISNWEGTSWNFSRWAPDRSDNQKLHELVLTEDELRELKRSLVLSPECECLLYGAIIAHGGIVIRATLEEFEELEEHVAADANHEEKKRRQRLLDRIYERIETLFDQEHYYGSDFEEWIQDNKQELSPEVEGFSSDWERKMNQEPDSSSIAKKSISADVVERTWQKIAGQSAKDAQKLVNRMSKEQPVVLAYLMAVDTDIFNQDEREVLLFLGVVVWQIMLQGTRPLPKVTEKILDKAEAGNLEMAEYLRGETEAGFEEATRKTIGGYKQPEVLRYVVEAIMEDTEESSTIREENKGIMFLDLKTVIDCFDA